LTPALSVDLRRNRRLHTAAGRFALHSRTSTLNDSSFGSPRHRRDEERFVNAVLQPLWDLQLVVGHQVRELADFDELDISNTEFLLAALDARPIYPATLDLFERLAARVAAVTAGERRSAPSTRCSS
jgi:hypothetical protein